MDNKERLIPFLLIIGTILAILILIGIIFENWYVLIPSAFFESVILLIALVLFGKK